MTLHEAIKVINKYLTDNNGTPELRAALFQALEYMNRANRRKKVVYAG